MSSGLASAAEDALGFKKEQVTNLRDRVREGSLENVASQRMGSSRMGMENRTNAGKGERML